MTTRHGRVFLHHIVLTCVTVEFGVQTDKLYIQEHGVHFYSMIIDNENLKNPNFNFKNVIFIICITFLTFQS